MEFNYDLFVIGAGSGGMRLCRTAAALGARVAVAEENRIGGTCVVRGCIPKKLLVYASRYPGDVEDAAGFGWAFGEGGFSWSALREAKNREVDRLVGVYANLLSEAGVTVYPGRAVVIDPHTVGVSGRQYTTRHIAIATGAAPMLPDIPGIGHALTSNDIFDLPTLPDSIAIVGGGYIAVEFACILKGLGSHVDLWHRGKQILRGFDEDVRNVLATGMAGKGIRLSTGSNVLAIEKMRDGTVELLLEGGQQSRYDAVLYATGRVPNTSGLGLEQSGVSMDRNGAIEVDAYSETSVASIHAIGDVTIRPQLTPVATRDAMLLASSLFGGMRRPVNLEYVPSAVFTSPEVAVVGLTEEHARARYGTVDVFKTSFRPLRHALSGRSERTFMKLVVERSGQRVVGAHMVGRDAAEIIQGVAIAIGVGATKTQFDETIGIHPTAAEEFVTMRKPVPITS